MKYLKEENWNLACLAYIIAQQQTSHLMAH